MMVIGWKIMQHFRLGSVGFHQSLEPMKSKHQRQAYALVEKGNKEKAEVFLWVCLGFILAVLRSFV
jgi:hypothetical protein